MNSFERPRLKTFLAAHPTRIVSIGYKFQGWGTDLNWNLDSDSRLFLQRTSWISFWTLDLRVSPPIRRHSSCRLV